MHEQAQENFMTTIGAQQRWEENRVPLGVPFCLWKQKIDLEQKCTRNMYFINSFFEYTEYMSPQQFAYSVFCVDAYGDYLTGEIA